MGALTRQGNIGEFTARWESWIASRCQLQRFLRQHHTVQSGNAEWPSVPDVAQSLIPV